MVYVVKCSSMMQKSGFTWKQTVGRFWSRLFLCDGWFLLCSFMENVNATLAYPTFTFKVRSGGSFTAWILQKNMEVRINIQFSFHTFSFKTGIKKKIKNLHREMKWKYKGHMRTAHQRQEMALMSPDQELGLIAACSSPCCWAFNYQFNSYQH